MCRVNQVVFLLSLSVLLTLLAIPANAATSFEAPVQGAVARKFDLSNGRFAGGGHRGVDFTVDELTPVSAAAKGTVTFAGDTPEGPTSPSSTKPASRPPTRWAKYEFPETRTSP